MSSLDDASCVVRYARQAVTGDYALPLCYMGAPTVLSELLYSAAETRAAVTAVTDIFNNAGTHL